MCKFEFRFNTLRPAMVCLFVVFPFAAQAQHQLSQSSYAPKIAAASDEGEQAIKRFKIAPGLKAELFAAEPHLANPVAFCFDEKGRVYVAETFRHSDGVGDIRGIMDWLDDELAARTVDDRMAYMKQRLGAKVRNWTAESERVKLLEDRDGDGRVDHSTVFADGFNTLLDGIGSGVLARKGEVYFANIPHLWLLRDTDGDGVANWRKSLHYGYGVRIGFLGHDLHGLRFGPDGKLYFTVGDRGSNVLTEGRRLGSPDTGDVFRCNPDGSELEVFATGLRNPQELAFDQFGNLFTGDNNSDSGDQARWVYLVEGGDSGWRVGYQFMEKPYARGPFNQEKIWHPQHEGQPAYIVPPLTNITAGPSGLTFNPGTGLPEKYNDHFFLCDFRGSDASRVYSFKLQPKGAAFEVADAEVFAQGLLATDVEFGVDGGIYVSDWVRGWDKTGRGRIYRFHDPAVDASPIVRETKRLLAEGMSQRSLDELAGLLAHRDQRVRQEAQFELADRGIPAINTLADVASKPENQIARLHAIWALGQVAARSKIQNPKSETWAAIEFVLRLLSDSDAEVRAQAGKVLGERRVGQAYEPLVALLQDPSVRVRFFAAMSLGKLGRSEAIGPVLGMLRENEDRDSYLRHAGVMALAGINDADSLVAAAKDTSRAARMGVLLALRRLERPEVAMFLNDPEPLLVVEAARAINDQPIQGAMMELAALLGKPSELGKIPATVREALVRRAINAALRVGTAETAQALVQFAAHETGAENMRAEALLALADWPRPSGRDRVVGLWRPVASTREVSVAAGALRPALESLLNAAPVVVRVAAIQAIQSFGLGEQSPALLALLQNTQTPEAARAAALKGLAALNAPQLAEALKLGVEDPSETVRKEAARVQAKLQPGNAAGQLARVLESGSLAEKQNALAAISSLPGDAADALLEDWLDRLIAGRVAPELHLDVLEATGKRSAKSIKDKLAGYEAELSKDGPLAIYRPALQGGDAKAGAQIFTERQDLACARCHKIDGEGGEVGPELTGLITQKGREYALESILFPNNEIAAGFDNLLVTLKSGGAYAGIVKSENAAELVLNSPEDGLVTVKKADINRRERGLSAMPEGMTNILSKKDLRDLIEFLATAK